MKISKLFHWLYFIVMMLPIFSIPIFAIYSHRHAIDSYSVQAEETKVVDFNQIINYYPSTSLYGVNVVNNGDYISLNGTVSGIGEYHVFPVSNQYSFKRDGTKYLVACYGNNGFKFGISGYGLIYSEPFVFFAESSTSWTGQVSLYLSNDDVVDLPSLTCYVVDLTKMFGAGNEPTAEQFVSWYPDVYYEYTLSDKQLLKTGNYITYNDTDIGSQFTYDVYNVVDKYFNYDNVFNFSQLYDYLNMTFFNGGASLGFFIFWHLLIYWLLTSILWLVFDVLMYVPQLVHRWLDKASLS